MAKQLGQQVLAGQTFPKNLCFFRMGRYAFSSFPFPLCVPAALSFPIEIPQEEAALPGAKIKKHFR